MNADIGASQERLREQWTEIVGQHQLVGKKARQIVSACRQLDPRRDERLRGDLVIHLTQRAERMLRPIVGAGMRDGGFDPVGEVVDDMVEAILDPTSTDGAGYEESFSGKLRFRLIDKIRRRKVRQHVEQPVPCDEESQPIETADGASLGPEDEAVIHSVLAQVPAKHRQAFQLHRLGFDYSSNHGESISTMLKVTPKTAKDWVNRATLRILQELDRAP